jgi:hypothetical protein
MQGVYPVQPVIPEFELRQYIHVMDNDQEVRSFIYAFGGATLNLTRYGDSRTDEVVHMIEHLMDYRSSVMRAMQSIFIHNCLMYELSDTMSEYCCSAGQQSQSSV